MGKSKTNPTYSEQLTRQHIADSDIINTDKNKNNIYQDKIKKKETKLIMIILYNY